MQAFHRLQFFKNCSNMGLYHRVQSFRDRLQQHGSPRGCSSYKTSGSTTGFPWVAASFRAHSRSPAWGHSWTVNMFSNMVHHALQGDSLLQHGTLEAAGEHLCSSAWSTSSPSFFTNLGVFRAVSHSSLFQLLLCRSSFPFLNSALTQPEKTLHIGLALDRSRPVWSHLKLALI